MIALIPLQPARAVQAGDAAPVWQARDMLGNAVNFPDTGANQTTVMVFWATWCPYCQVFMPYLPGIETDYAAQGVQVLAINTREETGGDPVTYMQTHSYNFTMIPHGDFIAEAYGVHYIPGLLIIGREGEVVYRRKSTDLPAGREIAEFWNEEVRAVLDQYLEEK
jgi:thiol-disulfide isomerase/thioredoxin